ncbi:sodium:solute symporter family transporter [Dyadobacter helix]|nr:hypothetical protein [Dyadobacter sp. CECT 9275]
MPQFLSQRYHPTVSLVRAIFWLNLYILVNLTSILYLGALTVSGISGLDFDLCVWGLAIFSIIITIGGMKVIGFTDVIRLFFLIIGGLATSYIAINLVSDNFDTASLLNGLKMMTLHHDDHFHMIFKEGSKHYMELPGLTVLLGGMWIVNLNYWDVISISRSERSERI